jgi:hypothetical protein
MPKDLQDMISYNTFPAELQEVIESGIAKFYAGSFVQKVMDSTISRFEYITAMSNNHQFVRWTTRLLARVAAETHHRELRNHYISHLKGEIDHDLWIENDLQELGADVAYIRDHMIPNTYIGQFMAVQESIAAFYKDPIQFLSVPIAIEAISAFMPRAFVDGLHRAIESWGVKNPQKASSFLTSHMFTDGGENGHWVATFAELKNFIKTEKQHQQAMHTARMVLDSVTRAYNSYVSPYPVDGNPQHMRKTAEITH